MPRIVGRQPLFRLFDPLPRGQEDTDADLVRGRMGNQQAQLDPRETRIAKSPTPQQGPLSPGQPMQISGGAQPKSTQVDTLPFWSAAQESTGRRDPGQMSAGQERALGIMRDVRGGQVLSPIAPDSSAMELLGVKPENLTQAQFTEIMSSMNPKATQEAAPPEVKFAPQEEAAKKDLVDVRKTMDELTGKNPASEKLPAAPEDELSTDDGGFDWGKFLSVVAPTLIGAAVGGKYGAAVGARAGTEFLTGQKTEREAKFRESVSLALKSGTPDGLRKLSKQKIKGFRSMQQVLTGVADAVEAKTDTKRRDRIMKLGEGKFFQSAMIEAARIGDVSLLADLESMEKAYGAEKLQSLASNEMALRKEFTSQTKPFVTVRDAYNRLKATATGTAAGDLALIFAYMKILDPGSVVRESEFANAENSGAAYQIVGRIWNRVRTGARLTDAQRKNFMAEAENLYKAQESTHNALVDTYTQIAGAYDYDVSRVVIDLTGRDSSKNPYRDLSKVSDEEFMKVYGYNFADPKTIEDKDEKARAIKNREAFGDYTKAMMERRGKKAYWQGA